MDDETLIAELKKLPSEKRAELFRKVLELTKRPTSLAARPARTQQPPTLQTR
jgi:hypothetical protein